MLENPTSTKGDTESTVCAQYPGTKGLFLVFILYILSPLCFVLETVLSFNVGWPQTVYRAKDQLEFLNLLPHLLSAAVTGLYHQSWLCYVNL